MKVTKELHSGWVEWDRMPKELLAKLSIKKSILGKWHYHYENKNGRIGLIRINCGVTFTKSGKWNADNMMWEACGVLDFARYSTRKEAEVEIYKTLKEPIPSV